jgi:hypothetical protein
MSSSQPGSFLFRLIVVTRFSSNFGIFENHSKKNSDCQRQIAGGGLLFVLALKMKNRYN